MIKALFFYLRRNPFFISKRFPAYILSGFCMILFFTGCAQTADNHSKGNIAVLSAEAFSAGINNGESFYLIDVRTPEEHNDMHIPGATLINYYESGFAEKFQAFEKDIPIYIYCATGGRSSDVSSILQQQGFTSVYDLKGGIYAWLRSNMPINGSRN